MKTSSPSRALAHSSLATAPAISERRNSSRIWLACALSCMCSSSTSDSAMLRMPAKPTSATARDTVLIVPPPAWRNCAVLTSRSSLLVSATSLQDLVGQARQVLVVRVGDALDAHDRIGQRRKVALVAHAAQQEVERAAARPRPSRSPARAAADAATAPARRGRPRRSAGAARHRARSPGTAARAARRRRRPPSGGSDQVFGAHAHDRAVRVALVQQPARRRASRRARRRRRTRPSPAPVPRRRRPRATCSRACRRCARRSRRRAARAAMPKSITRARPAGSTRMFDGFRSRCTSPAACAAASASSTPSSICTAARAGIAPVADALGQRRPGDVLEHQVGLAVVHVGLEHRHDVRMGQPADVARLVQPVADRRGVAVGAAA